ncbi:quinone-dependent dihydroorotate dehydrogenase [Propionimicrobium sp. PCR01-08-3]|uniref:quinone-dependent dihydroorotate dehydrogenase n=1 Tax=Propionimicrobium sp. PCR01-08-3 TaxID=3052086 RepID=UPI00255CF7A8|nr:quinone-dependent dihydroorotate dehydrogenase [Propionimicrobium sp. PCR01-08-3]WIY83898.1 quinone-dependent dihydroorotate dehydrogenase [Propionimicrobium sp. PCR01-08-3]
MVTSDELVVRLLLTSYRGLVRPVLFAVANGDPEEIHQHMITLLSELPDPVLDQIQKYIGERRNPVQVAGVDFPGRVGVAAGLDKDGLAAMVWGALGFGFAELGTVTAHAQPGNRQPRLFRLPHSRAVINRMGFNNSGVEALAARLNQWNVRRGTNALDYPVGVSIGKTKATPLEEAVDDYLHSLRTIAPYADYVAINVSSPNTPGLRSLQDRDALTGLTTALVQTAAELDPDHPLPIFVKLAPDLAPYDVSGLIEVCQSSGISGLIATNTTTGREFLHPSELHLANQAGGLSGAPLTRKALRMVESIAGQTDLPIMGVGGIMTPTDAQSFFDAGAALVQIYTGFIFNGPALIRGINTLTAPERTLL